MWGWVGGAAGDLASVSASEMGILAAGAGSIVLSIVCGAVGSCLMWLQTYFKPSLPQIHINTHRVLLEDTYKPMLCCKQAL